MLNVNNANAKYGKNKVKIYFPVNFIFYHYV